MPNKQEKTEKDDYDDYDDYYLTAKNKQKRKDNNVYTSKHIRIQTEKKRYKK